MIINRIYKYQNLLSLQFFSFLVGLRTYQHPCMPTNLWVLMMSSLPCLRISAGMPSVPGALLLFNFYMFSWVSCFVGACIPISPLCVKHVACLQSVCIYDQFGSSFVHLGIPRWPFVLSFRGNWVDLITTFFPWENPINSLPFSVDVLCRLVSL
jgi:hypothetical protein